MKEVCKSVADELYSMLHVPRLKDEDSAELFLGFRVGAVATRYFPVLPIQRSGRFLLAGALLPHPSAAFAEMVIVIKARVEHGVSLALSHAIECSFVVIA